jgi:hypothetical protein
MAHQLPLLRAVFGSVIRQNNSLLQATQLPANQRAIALGAAIGSIGSTAADHKEQRLGCPCCSVGFEVFHDN